MSEIVGVPKSMLTIWTKLRAMCHLECDVVVLYGICVQLCKNKWTNKSLISRPDCVVLCLRLQQLEQYLIFILIVT